MDMVAATGPFVEGWGYSRAVRSGQLIEVSGTNAMTPDGIVSVGDLYGQTHNILTRIVRAVEELGGTADQIVRTRVLLRDSQDWAEAGRAHLEIFAGHLPASTCIGGSDFIIPELLVEIEATAWVPEGADGNTRG